MPLVGDKGLYSCTQTHTHKCINHNIFHTAFSLKGILEIYLPLTVCAQENYQLGSSLSVITELAFNSTGINSHLLLQFSEKLTSNLETKLGVGSRKIQTRRKDELKQKKENYVRSPKGKKNYEV